MSSEAPTGMDEAASQVESVIGTMRRLLDDARKEIGTLRARCEGADRAFADLLKERTQVTEQLQNARCSRDILQGLVTERELAEQERGKKKRKPTIAAGGPRRRQQRRGLRKQRRRIGEGKVQLLANAYEEVKQNHSYFKQELQTRDAETAKQRFKLLGNKWRLERFGRMKERMDRAEKVLKMGEELAACGSDTGWKKLGEKLEAGSFAEGCQEEGGRRRRSVGAAV